MPALKFSPFRSALKQRVRLLASRTANILRFPARQEAVSADPARRRMMAGTFAAVAVSPLPAFGGGGPGTDPIFAAIERHRAAADRSSAAHEAYQEADQAVKTWRPGTTMDKAEYSEYRKLWDTDPRVQAALQRSGEARQIRDDAFLAILGTKPTTDAGLVALAAYGVELDGEEEGVICEAAPPAVRILAAIAGLPEVPVEIDDEGDEA